MRNRTLAAYTYIFILVLMTSHYSARAYKPNVIIIMADYMGYCDTEPFGSKDIKTPALTRLASEGIKYINFYAPAPICSPSRAALLTGKYPVRAGIESNVTQRDPGLTSNHVTMAAKLKDIGYATSLIGKWHLGFSSDANPNAHGFDTFFGFKDWSIDYYSHKSPQGHGLYFNDNKIEVEGYITDIFSDSAVAFIEKYKTQPFFLCLLYNATLPPLQIPGNPDDVRDISTWNNNTRDDYIKVVERLDAGIGQVLEKLRESGLENNTLLIFTYDHGGQDYVDHGDFSHGFGTLWEGGIRAPLIIRYPKLQKKNIVDPRIAINMDLTATILSTCGVSKKDDLDGIDLFSENVDSNRTLYWRGCTLHF